jgi:hypothetical protein
MDPSPARLIFTHISSYPVGDDTVGGGARHFTAHSELPLGAHKGRFFWTGHGCKVPSPAGRGLG